MTQRYDLPSEVAVTSEGAIRVVTLNRPDDLNAANAVLHSALAHVWDQIAADQDARAVVVTGAGRAFSAGGDFDLMSRMLDDVEIRNKTLTEGRMMLHSLVRLPQPVVAAVNGPAVGLGCSLALMSDFVILAEDAFLADPHLQVGLAAGDGGMVFPLHVGLLRAKQAVLLGDRISSAQALDWGLATTVVARGDVLPTAMTLARRLAAMPAAALQGTKRALNGYVEQQLAGPFESALEAETKSMASAEHRELVEALIAKARARDAGQPSA